MIRLLNIEWKKIYYYKATRVFTLIYFLLLILIGVILAYIEPEIGGQKLDIAKLGMFNFPEIWQNISFLVAILKIFIAVIIITNVTNEYANRTLKQNLIDGLSKKEFLTSKVLTNTLFAGLSTIFVFVICLLLGLTFSHTNTSIFKGMEYIGAYFLKLSLFFSICLFLSIWLRKTAFAFLGLIVLWFAEGLLSGIELGIKTLLGSSLKDITTADFHLTDYLPLNTSSKLIDLPTIKVKGFIEGGSIFQYQTIDYTFVGAALIYIALFIFFSYRLLKKRDL